MSRVPGTFKNRPAHPRRDRSPEGIFAEELLLGIGALTAERYVMGGCLVMLAREPIGRDWLWHLSVSHPAREPTWDEIKTAVYDIDTCRRVMDDGLAWSQILGRVDEGQWVNVHDNCFHLYAIPDLFRAGESSRLSLPVAPDGPDTPPADEALKCGAGRGSDTTGAGARNTRPTTPADEAKP